MIVICSSCSNRFRLEDSLIPAEGRMVRCTVCTYTWKQLPEKSSPAQTPPFIELNAAKDFSPPLSVQKKPSKWGGIILFFGIFAILFNILVFGRNIIVGLWPTAERGYAILGLPAYRPGAGLVISELTPQVSSRGEVEMVVVRGHIKNLSNHSHDLSSLTIKVLGDPAGQGEKQTLDHWTHYLPRNSINPGEIIVFETAPRPKVVGGKIVTVGF